MLINFPLTAYTVLVVTEQCCGIHFLELPGFDSEVSHEQQGIKKPSNIDPNTGNVHRTHHKKSVDHKHFRRMQAEVYRNPKRLDQYQNADITSLKKPAQENINQEVQDTVPYYEREIINSEISAENENMKSRNIDTSVAVQTGRHFINPLLKQKVTPVHGVEDMHWLNSQVPIVRKNMESQNNNAAAVQINRQNRYSSSKQEAMHGGNEKKYWRSTAIPTAGEDIVPQNIDRAATEYTERQNGYSKQDVTPLQKLDERFWHQTKVPVARENMEVQNTDAAEGVQSKRRDRYPPIKPAVRETMESLKNYADAQTEHHGRYPPLKQRVRENLEPHSIDEAKIVQKPRQSGYSPLKQLNEEEIEPEHNNAAIQAGRPDRYPPLKQNTQDNMELYNDDTGVQPERQNIYPPLKQMVTTDYYVERRHWLVARKDGDSSYIPPINKDDKDATLKAKINMLVNQTVRDTDDKVKSIQDVKDAHREKAPYKIGFIVSMVKKSRDVLNELFNVAVKHRDEWKALEQLKIFELIVHTNVDTTNLVRQLVEIHVQHLNSTSSTGDETTEARGGGRRVVLI